MTVPPASAARAFPDAIAATSRTLSAVRCTSAAIASIAAVPSPREVAVLSVRADRSSEAEAISPLA
jgi:hypothetical protein